MGKRLTFSLHKAYEEISHEELMDPEDVEYEKHNPLVANLAQDEKGKKLAVDKTVHKKAMPVPVEKKATNVKPSKVDKKKSKHIKKDKRTIQAIEELAQQEAKIEEDDSEELEAIHDELDYIDQTEIECSDDKKKA